MGIVVFVTNVSGHNINPDNLYALDNLYGSEYSLYETAKILSDLYTVYITIPKPSGYYRRIQNINWIAECDFNKMSEYVLIDHLVIMRFMDPFYKLKFDNVVNIYYWLLDTIPLLQHYPRESLNLTNRVVKRHISIGTPPIKEFYIPFGILDNFVVIRCGITPQLNWTLQKLLHSPRKPLSFVFSSSVGKGLINILNFWPRLLSRFPTATLDIYYGYSENESQGLLKYIEKYPSIKYHGKSIQRDLWEAYKFIDYWVFPNQDAETSCNTTFETAHFGPIQIANNKCSLNENLSGCKIPITNVDECFYDIVLDGIEYLETFPAEKTRIRKRQFESSLQNTWMHRRKDWVNLFNLP